MLTVDPQTTAVPKLHGLMLGAIGPRPIAFASTMDEEGNPNLSPFSFFNVFSANPPILIFSPARRVRNNTTKHTLENVEATREVVINIVNYAIVQQMSLSSTEYPEDVDEFVKAGLTPLESETVKPFRVMESPVQFECKVNDIIHLGEQGGAGNLVICEVTRMHVEEALLNEEGGIDQYKIDQVARMGGNWYSRANLGMFEVPKPLSSLGIGVDAIPAHIRNSTILTGNDLGMLGNVEELPDEKAVDALINSEVQLSRIVAAKDRTALHRKAQEYLSVGDTDRAWKVLLALQ
ncbi:flavin reductase family protein [Croceiramulus getboli]|nr:flavin reductase family protein [Flavobacteriaceae bacterium YJPT1-3]